MRMICQASVASSRLGAAWRPRARATLLPSFRFEPLRGVGHFAADQVPERVSKLEHLREYPCREWCER